VLARQEAGAPPGASTAARAALSTAAAGGAGTSGGDADFDHLYRELLRRLREEQEQLGQAVNEPF
jgi:hypothetical protein